MAQRRGTGATETRPPKPFGNKPHPLVEQMRKDMRAMTKRSTITSPPAFSRRTVFS